MTLLSILNIFASAGDKLVALLQSIKASYPDTAVKVDEMLAALNNAVGLGNLVQLASILPRELVDISQGRIEPKNHPSDLA